MPALDPTDTIAAIASPPGPAPRGIVRLSGPRAWEIARAGFEPEAPGPEPRFAAMRPGRLAVAGVRVTLPVSLALWPAPRTYTGQAVAELHMVGSPPLLDRVLAHYLTLGARAAEPGEFTLRAFLSGRLDLTRAEAVLGVIEAHSPAQLDAALEQLAGGLAGPIGLLRDRLLDVVAHLEAGLDFVDEADVDPIARARLAAELDDAAREVARLGATLRDRDRSEAMPRVVLVGPPNAGKSRLFNALLAEDRAIVSPVAGTTRDYLTAPCACDGLTVELVDTAGAEEARDAIAGEAQARRAREAARADLRLVCIPLDAPGASAPADAGPGTLVVGTKADLAPAPPGCLPTSAATGDGLPGLRAAIARALAGREADAGAMLSTGPRCREALAHAADCLHAAAEATARGDGDELVAIDLRQSADELGKVVGAVVTDDILDRIFRRFCIGK